MLDKKTVKKSVEVGKKLRITVPGQTITDYKSSKTKVADVSTDGLVTLLNEGKANITATTVKGKKSAKLKLKLVDPTIPTKIALAPKGTVKLGLGETVQLTCQLTPSTAETDIEWKSSNESVATVNNGLVTPLKAGNVTITATTVKGKKSAKVKIKIK